MRMRASALRVDHHREGVDRHRLTLELERAERLEGDSSAEPVSRRAIDQDRALRDLGVRLDPGGEVDDIAYARVRRAIGRACVAGDHFAGCDAHTDPDL